MRVLKQYGWIIRGMWQNHKGVLCLYVFISLFGNMLPTIVAYSQRLFVNSLGAHQVHPSLPTVVVVLLAGYVFLRFVRSIYQYVDSYVAHSFIFKANFTFNRYLWIALYRERQQSFYDPDFNDHLNRVVKGYSTIPFHVFAVNEVFILIMVILLQIRLIIGSSPVLLVIVVLNSVFASFHARSIAEKEYDLEYALSRDQRKSDYYADTLTKKTYAKEIRIFGARQYLYSKWIDKYESLNRKRNDIRVKKQGYELVNSSINYFLNIGTLVILFYQLFVRQIDFGSFVFLYGIMLAAAEQAKSLVQTSLGELHRNYLHIQDYIEYVDRCAGAVRESPRVGSSGEFHSLEAHNISFMYPASKEYAVKDASFGINKGEIISILGYNGSGKTTLCKIITGLLLPSSGDIYVNGRNVKEMTVEDVSVLFGIAYQDFPRYQLSVRDNIGFGFIERYSDSAVSEALKNADGQSLLEKMPQAFDTRLGKMLYKDGIDLSGGEWQKLVLARAYMGRHEILVLDEPTASIDPLREMELLAHFRAILQGRTAILISHRIGFARLADRIVMMDNGSIVESGTHSELLRLNGLYNRLFSAQKKLYEA